MCSLIYDTQSLVFVSLLFLSCFHFPYFCSQPMSPYMLIPYLFNSLWCLINYRCSFVVETAYAIYIGLTNHHMLKKDFRFLTCNFFFTMVGFLVPAPEC